MASLQISDDIETPSIVDLGERKVTLVMGHRSEQALMDLVNERRRKLRERTPDGTPVVGPVANVEEALLDAIGGIGAAGGSPWFRRNF